MSRDSLPKGKRSHAVSGDGLVATSSGTPMHVQMAPRSPDEAHRVATPLELFFDLVFVVAIAQDAASLHHAVSEANVAHGLKGYTYVFFAFRWAWMCLC